MLKIIIVLALLVFIFSCFSPKTQNFKLIEFEAMPREILSDTASRRYVYGNNAMIARFEFKKGSVINKHEHPSEQMTYITKGSVKVNIQNKEIIVKAGDVLIIPPNIPHRFEALEDTIDLDIFSPPRQDWINGTDDYFKKR